MSSIRAKGNESTELKMAKVLRRAGVRGWRRHVRLPGTPDFAWHKNKLAVFVDGCFWHGCPRCYLPPKHNPGFWQSKVLGNRRRDKRVTRLLRAGGWKVIRVWECRIDNTSTLNKIRRALELSTSNRTGLRWSGHDESGN